MSMIFFQSTLIENATFNPLGSVVFTDQVGNDQDGGQGCKKTSPTPPPSRKPITKGKKRNSTEDQPDIPTVYLIPGPLFLETNEDGLVCPIAECNKRLTKRNSLAVHIKDHIGHNPTHGLIINSGDFDKDYEYNYYQIDEETTSSTSGSGTKDEYNLRYRCPVETCQYSKNGTESFPKLKYLKQHYLKMHSSKTFKCPKENCNKSFSTLPYLLAHQRICGILFTCSCSKTYPTLISLQTHVRRKCHNYDAELYKNLIDDAKKSEKLLIDLEDADRSSRKLNTTKELDYDNGGRNEPVPQPVAFTEVETIQSTTTTNAEPVELAEIGTTIATTTNTSNNFYVRVVPKLLPRPNTNTVQYFIIDNLTSIQMETIPGKVDIGTQTATGHLRKRSASSSVNEHHRDSNSVNKTSQQRKNSAGTQTGKYYRAKVSTETQTLTKRRRCTKRKQSAETQTLQHILKPPTATTVQVPPTNVATANISQFVPPAPPSVAVADKPSKTDLTLPIPTSSSSIHVEPILPTTTELSTPTFEIKQFEEPQPSTSRSVSNSTESQSFVILSQHFHQNDNATSPMPWSFDDDPYDLFGGELNGIHIETQTDDNENWNPSNLPTDLLNNTIDWTDTTESLNLVTTETQTKDKDLAMEDEFHFDSSLLDVYDHDHHSSSAQNINTNKEQLSSIREENDEELLNTPINQGISTFLTIDSETQTL